MIKHTNPLTRPRPGRADNCVTLPVTPSGILRADIKEALGWERQPNDLVGSIILCK